MTSSPVAFVTGGTGFVGTHLVRGLVQAGWIVHILIRPRSNQPKGSSPSTVILHMHDGTTEGMVGCIQTAAPDVVFHLASVTCPQHDVKSVEPMIQSNVMFATQLLEGMRVCGVTRLINTGTFWQHYNGEPYNPVCLYAATKQAFDAILEYYVQACGVKAVTLELFDTYGAADQRGKLICSLNKAALSGESLDMSPGEQLIDLVHIDDVIEAYIIAAGLLQQDKVQKHDRYSVSSGNAINLRELVRIYMEATDQPININWGIRKYRDREVMVPWRQGCILPNWKPKTGLVEGIKAVFQHVRLNHSAKKEN